MRRPVKPAVVVVSVFLAVSAHSDGPEFRGGTGYVLRVQPEDDQITDPGWGIGFLASWYLPGVPRLFVFEAGFDAGNLDAARPNERTPFLAASHDYYRIYGGVSAAVHGRSPVKPHAGVHLALARQEVRFLRFDTAFGQFEQLDADSKSGLTYDATAGLLVKLVRRVDLDLGLRYLRLPRLAIDSDTGRSSASSGFALYYLGVAFHGE